MNKSSTAKLLLLYTAFIGYSPTIAASTTTLGSAFISATRANASGAGLPADIVVDGNSSSSATFAGDETYTIDAGVGQQMQGVYLWLPDSRNTSYWVKLESSRNGQDWETQWRAINSQRNETGKPVYLPFPKSDQPIRYLRLSESGNLGSVSSGLSEARWLPADHAVANDPDIPIAHWRAPAGPSPLEPFWPGIAFSQPLDTPNLVSWSLLPTNYLSAATLVEAELQEANCPKIGASSLYPETLVVNATGQMPNFTTEKTMPDGTQVVVLDWSHVDLSHDYGGTYVGFSGGYPIEQGVLREGRDINSSTNQHAFPLVSGHFCDGGHGDSHYSRGHYYQTYWQYVQNGSHAADINAHWDTPIPKPAHSYSAAVNLGRPFERVQGDEGMFGSVMANAIDGYVDIDSRWSHNADGSLTLVTGPSITDAPPVRGLYLWMHRSNQRRSTVSITARADTEGARILLPPTKLPMTTSKEQPVFIPIHADSKHYKHITITGHGNDGSGGSDSVWSSIAEVRYSDSSVAPPGVPVVQTPTCFPFSHAYGNTSSTAITSNSPALTIDNDTSNLNYWASNQPAQLLLDAGSSNVISKFKIWMHKSHLRTSDITVELLSNTHLPPVMIQSAHIPLSAMSQGETITLSAPTSARYLKLYFYGNSQSDWNSISEVCWQ